MDAVKNLLNRLERKAGRFAVHNLMFILVVGMFTLFAAELAFPQLNLYDWLSFRRDLIFQGQVWRLITFIFLPPNSSIFWIVFTLYFYYMIGDALERQWGAFRFNVYYLIGVIGLIISGMITGFTANAPLNMSLFFAFAVLFPDYQVMLFFMIPVKIKYLAFVDALLFIISLVMGSLPTKIAILFSLLNFFLFFGGDFISRLKNQKEYRKNQKNFRDYMNNQRWR